MTGHCKARESGLKADNALRAAVILDRDGVLNVDHGYVGDVSRLEWITGAKRAVRRLNDAGLLVIVATNQSGVARGLFDLSAVDRLHEVMTFDISRETGGRIDSFYVCPYLPNAPVARPLPIPTIPTASPIPAWSCEP